MRIHLFLFCMALLLFGCTAVPDPTPTPQSLSAAPTIAVTRPTITNTAVPPTASHTPTTTHTPIPTASATTTRWPTSTPRPRPTSTFTPTPRPPSPPPERHPYIVFALSSLGRVWFIQDGILHVENTPGSGDFLEIGGFVTAASWSPDGRSLLYSQVKTLDPFNTTYEQRLWSAEDGTDVSLTDFIPSYPESGYRLFLAHWSPDGNKILFQSHPDGRHEEFLHRFNFFVLSVADLQQGTIADVGFMTNTSEIVWQTNGLFVVREHCGSPCEIYDAFDYSGRLLFSRRTAGLADFTSYGNWMVSPGGSAAEPSEGTPYPTPEHSQDAVEAIDLATGTITLLWEDTSRPGGIALFPGHISPDGQLVSFNFTTRDPFTNPGILFIIDLSGREILQYPDSQVLAWQPDNHLIVAQHLENNRQQLVYLSLDGTAQIVQVQTAGNEFVSARWSPDSRFLAYTIGDWRARTGQVYLWQAGNSQPTLIPTTTEGNPLSQIIGWLPDSTGFYFVDSGLWLYKVETAELTLIASMYD